MTAGTEYHAEMSGLNLNAVRLAVALGVDVRNGVGLNIGNGGNILPAFASVVRNNGPNAVKIEFIPAVLFKIRAERCVVFELTVHH